MYRLHPLWLRVRELVTAGTIGELEAIQVFFAYYNVDPDNIRNIAEYGGGALMDVGCYAINVARWMFDGEPTDVWRPCAIDPRFGTDVVTSAVLDFAGRHATFTCSTQTEPDQRVHLIGSTGRLLVEIPFNIPPDLPDPHHPRRRVATHPSRPGSTSSRYRPPTPTPPSATPSPRPIRNGSDVPIPPQDAVANMAVIDRILEDSSGPST